MISDHGDASLANLIRNTNLSSTNTFAEILLVIAITTSWGIIANIFILYSMKKHATLRGPKYILVQRNATCTLIFLLLRPWIFVFVIITETPRYGFDFIVLTVSNHLSIFFLCSSVMYQVGTLIYQYISSWYLVNISQRNVNLASVFGTLLIALIDIASCLYEYHLLVGIFMLFSAVASIGLCLSMLYRRSQREETALNTSNILLLPSSFSSPPISLH